MFMRLLLLAFLLCGLFYAVAPVEADTGDDELLKFVRISHNGKDHYGILSLGQVRLLDRTFLDPQASYTGEIVPLNEAKLLAPVKPGKVIGVALNYASHGGSGGTDIGLFSKLPSSITAHEAIITPPPGSGGVDYEGELVLVIADKVSKVSEKQAPEHIFGVTIGNDVTDRAIGTGGFSIIRGKGSDTFGPLGPWIVRGLNYDDLTLTTKLNGKTVQQTRTSKAINKSARLVSYISQYITLERGDVIYTGTSGTTHSMQAGDVVEITLEGVGTLRNTVGAPAK
jgi:2-keto-4-pentenoate hydratase/2-oxohepta-3-ene-1,7-dioic acid hydratase in catechol pathway